jgi:hypothetical protein
VQCSAVQCSAVQCSAVQCSAVQCSAVQCSTLPAGEQAEDEGAGGGEVGIHLAAQGQAFGNMAIVADGQQLFNGGGNKLFDQFLIKSGRTS